ncbi:PREDICTED: eukaryotic translation initiation factor 5B-like [Mandrillus leucophaeus]|uniref:eukaryotic translation initiation factor 5B-like n=1 Tax=Mandrillus leucophaeus TaxID=9568 RepID=UPI0005F487CE|nr:PREDICTED: eukaryotic translation initiation factor 5B-like [Mandrillus leucophaeus]
MPSCGNPHNPMSWSPATPLKLCSPSLRPPLRRREDTEGAARRCPASAANFPRLLKQPPNPVKFCLQALGKTCIRDGKTCIRDEFASPHPMEKDRLSESRSPRPERRTRGPRVTSCHLFSRVMVFATHSSLSWFPKHLTSEGLVALTASKRLPGKSSLTIHKYQLDDHQRAPALDTSSEIITKDLKKKEVVEEAENGRDAPANGNANEENREQEADNEVDEEEEEGGEEEEEEKEGDGEEEDGDEDEEAESATGKPAAEDDEDDDVHTNKQKTDKDD